MGYEPEKKALQFESMDDGLRMAIHNVLREYETTNNLYYTDIYRPIWKIVMERDIDEFDSWGGKYLLSEIKKYFFNLPWNKVYDYVEWYLIFQDDPVKLVHSLNTFFKYHNSAYQIVENKIIPITNSEELSEVSDACHTGQKAIDHHMKKAIVIFSSRETKDYANVIKEAISAVEAAVNIVNGSEGKTLGDALKQLDKKKKMPETLKVAFDKLYGYTCEKDTGIRHALINDAQYPPDFADAKFMLVACSAFVNYLLQRNQ